MASKLVNLLLESPTVIATIEFIAEPGAEWGKASGTFPEKLPEKLMMTLSRRGDLKPSEGGLMVRLRSHIGWSVNQNENGTGY
jgi:hypothetical protein